MALDLTGRECGFRRAGLARGQVGEVSQSQGQQPAPQGLTGAASVGGSRQGWIGTARRPAGHCCPWLGQGQRCETKWTRPSEDTSLWVPPSDRSSRWAVALTVGRHCTRPVPSSSHSLTQSSLRPWSVLLWPQRCVHLRKQMWRWQGACLVTGSRAEAGLQPGHPESGATP